MWSCRWNGRYGPRPGQPSNILAMDYYEWYEPSERAEMLSIYAGEGNTHAVTGPMIDTGGYHGQYPTYPGPLTQDWGNHYLDCMEEWQTNSPRITPVHFIHPDGWSADQMEQLVPFYSQPRAQALLPIIVATGWEPTRYDWKAAYWAKILKRWSEVMPKALWLIHTVTDTDAPTGDGDDHGYDINQSAAMLGMTPNEVCDLLHVARGTTSLPPSNGTAWAFCVPFLHGWLIQNGPYDKTPAQNPQLATNFGAQFMATGEGAQQHSIAWHFAGNAGWPTWSAWGAPRVKLYNGECTAYNSYWKNLPQTTANDWGNLAMSSGADGYLDGGTVAVP